MALELVLDPAFQDINQLEFGFVDVPLTHFVGARRDQPDDVRPTQPAGREGDPEVAILRIGAQTVGFEIGLVQMADREGLHTAGGLQACGGGRDAAAGDGFRGSGLLAGRTTHGAFRGDFRDSGFFAGRTTHGTFRGSFGGSGFFAGRTSDGTLSGCGGFLRDGAFRGGFCDRGFFAGRASDGALGRCRCFFSGGTSDRTFRCRLNSGSFFRSRFLWRGSLLGGGFLGCRLLCGGLFLRSGFGHDVSLYS